MKLLNLSNWVTSLVESFTFYGGGSGGGGSQQSTTKNELDPTIRPFVEYGLQEAKSLYQGQTPQYYPGQTYVGPSEQTQTALQAAQNRALGGMNNDNRLMINKYFGERSEKFDFINCQFVMHYFLKDDVTWNKKAQLH